MRRREIHQLYSWFDMAKSFSESFQMATVSSPADQIRGVQTSIALARSDSACDIEMHFAELESPVVRLLYEQILIAPGHRRIDLSIVIPHHEHVTVGASLGTTDADNAVEGAMLDPVHSAGRQTDA